MPSLATVLSEKDPKLLLDGSMGAILMSKGFYGAGVYSANQVAPDLIQSIHEGYLAAGADLFLTNTFSITSEILDQLSTSAEKAVGWALDAAQRARENYPEAYIALSLAPCGFMEPFETLEKHFSERILPSRGRVDAIFFETFSSSEELKLAIAVARAITDVPILASMTFNEKMVSWAGESLPEAIRNVMQAKPDAVGMNCTIPPEDMLDLAAPLLEAVGGRCPVLAEPNRGTPEYRAEGAVYTLPSWEFADGVEKIYNAGIHIVGGCCGSDEECIRMVHDRVFAEHEDAKSIGNP